MRLQRLSLQDEVGALIQGSEEHSQLKSHLHRTHWDHHKMVTVSARNGPHLSNSQQVSCLPPRHEELSLDPTHIKAGYVGNPGLGRQRQVAPCSSQINLAQLIPQTPGSVRDPARSPKRWSTTEENTMSTSGLHIYTHMNAHEHMHITQIHTCINNPRILKTGRQSNSI